VLDNLEFHHLYGSLSSLRAASFNILKADGFSLHYDLRVSTPKIEGLEDLKDMLRDTASDVKIYSRHDEMIERFLVENNFGHIPLIPVSTHLLSSFSYPEKAGRNTVIICDDLLGKIFIKKRLKKKLSADIDLLLKIQNGDFVVHIDHGIGVFIGIIKKEL
jgi:hypothetical protein